MNNSDNSENSSTDNSAKEVEGTQSSANFFETVKNFSLKEKITSARLSFNDTLKSLVPSEVIPKQEENMLDVVKRPLYQCSEYSQQNFPYMSTVTRTHAPEIIGAYTTGMGLISLSKSNNLAYFYELKGNKHLF